MAKSKLVKVNEKIADEVVSDYKKMKMASLMDLIKYLIALLKII